MNNKMAINAYVSKIESKKQILDTDSILLFARWDWSVGEIGEEAR